VAGRSRRAGEVRTAAARRLANGLDVSDDDSDQGDFLRVRVYQRGKLSAELNLAAAIDHGTTRQAAPHERPPTIDWSAAWLPTLHEKPMPGHPVRAVGRTCCRILCHLMRPGRIHG
jgi:hypothetical protein